MFNIFEEEQEAISEHDAKVRMLLNKYAQHPHLQDAVAALRVRAQMDADHHGITFVECANYLVAAMVSKLPPPHTSKVSANDYKNCNTTGISRILGDGSAGGNSSLLVASKRKGIHMLPDGSI